MNDPVERRQFEVDVVALGASPGVGGQPLVLAVGEAKASESPVALAELERLERLRARLATRADVSRAKLLLFGLSGFEAALRRTARGRPDVELVDLERCYEGE